MRSSTLISSRHPEQIQEMSHKLNGHWASVTTDSAPEGNLDGLDSKIPINYQGLLKWQV